MRTGWYSVCTKKSGTWRFQQYGHFLSRWGTFLELGHVVASSWILAHILHTWGDTQTSSGCPKTQHLRQRDGFGMYLLTGYISCAMLTSWGSVSIEVEDNHWKDFWGVIRSWGGYVKDNSFQFKFRFAHRHGYFIVKHTRLLEEEIFLPCRSGLNI